MGTQNRGLLNGFINRKNTQVIAVCDVDTTRRNNAKKMADDFYAKQTGSNYKGCATYGDFRSVLERKDIDAVVIATPDHWHALISIMAAKAGKDIYCEKPLSETIHEARAMVNAVRKHKRVFQTGSMQRSSREFRIATELVRNGAIGKISTVTVQIGGPGVPCDLGGEELEPGLDWDLWLGPAPTRPYNSILSPRGVHRHFPDWRKYLEFGGGMVTDWGAHHFDIAQWGLNMDNSGPVEVVPPSDPKATHGARIKYASGVEVVHEDGNGVTFHGSEGKIYVNRGKFEMWIGSQKKAEDRDGLAMAEKEYLTNAKDRVYASNDHYGDWLNCIGTRKPPICDVEVGARTVTVCHLVNLAYHHHQTVKWNPAKEKFVGGAGKAEWLDREHRWPWVIPAV